MKAASRRHDLSHELPHPGREGPDQATRRRRNPWRSQSRTSASRTTRQGMPSVLTSPPRSTGQAFRQDQRQPPSGSGAQHVDDWRQCLDQSRHCCWPHLRCSQVRRRGRRHHPRREDPGSIVPVTAEGAIAAFAEVEVGSPARRSRRRQVSLWATWFSAAADTEDAQVVLYSKELAEWQRSQILSPTLSVRPRSPVGDHHRHAVEATDACHQDGHGPHACSALAGCGCSPPLAV